MLDSKAQRKIIDYWIKLAERNWKTAKSLLKLGHYDMCLFCCHLVLEKYLKASVVLNTKDNPPHIHDLNRLAIIAKLEVSDERKKFLNEITKFNIQARYDDIKLAFYKKATKDYTGKYVEITEELIIWLKKEFRKQ